MAWISRRHFLQRTGWASFAGWASARCLYPQTAQRWRAAVIGCTGAGDYGHNLDRALEGFDSVQVTSVADPDPVGRARVAERVHAQRHYADYREMLAREPLDLVVVAPRWSERHHEMILAALNKGCHVLCEKPVTTTLVEADEILALARRRGLRLAVAHQMRLAPCVVHLQKALADGLLGELIQLRSWGKQDARAGGEDLLVLGTHIFDTMRLLAGDVLTCSAQVWQQGREITIVDRRSASERIGWIAGDEIEARFQFPKGVTATFTSRKRLRETLGHWGIELLGSEGAARIALDIDPAVFQRRVTTSSEAKISEEWTPLRGDPSIGLSADERGFGPANRRVVRDWLDAIVTEREPQCSGLNAAKALECVMAVYESALRRATVNLPLAKREHPLG